MRLVRALLAVLAAGLAVAPGASAALLLTEKRCYQEGADVVTGGLDFLPSSLVSVSLDGVELGLTVTDARGLFRNKFVTPDLPAGKHERLHTVGATDGKHSEITRYRSTEVSAGFSPGAGNLGTLRVRFNVYGFGVYKRAAKVYVHYVRPDGKLRRTVRLGTAQGTCGHIRRTRKRLLFPFVPERGTWTLQFDTRSGYGKATAASSFAWVRRPVRVGG